VAPPLQVTLSVVLAETLNAEGWVMVADADAEQP